MGALSRFLDKDAAAKAVLLAVLGTSPIPAAADAINAHPAKAPVAHSITKGAQPAKVAVLASPSGEISPEAILVALQGEASKLGKVVGMLRDSTDRCLSDQARLLGDVSAATSRPEALSAVAARGQDLADDLEHDEAMDAATDLRVSGHLVNENYDTLERHARMRNACLDWSDRTVAFLKDRLSDPGTGTVSTRLAEARAASARDLDRLMAMGPSQDGNGADAIEAMGMRPPGM